MSEATSLPPGFQDLEPFVAYWAGETTEKRLRARCEASMAEIQHFYDTVVERADVALEYLETLPLYDLPEDAGRLLRLVLALGQASVAVEIHGQPRAPGTPWPNSLVVEIGAAPFG